MKSLILWNVCKSYSDRVWSSLGLRSRFSGFWAVLLFALFFLGCSEKIPTLPLNKNLVAFDSVTVTPDLIADTTIFESPYIGSNSYLVVGEDDNISAYSILLFEELDTPLDTISIDRVISCDLVLRTGSYLPIDTVNTPTITMSIYSLERDTAVYSEVYSWTEDSAATESEYLKFDLNNYDKTAWCEQTYSDSDTIICDLTTGFLENMRDASKTHYGIVIEPSASSQNGLGIIYSGETSYYPYIRVTYVDADGDTVAAALTADEDVTITEFKKNLLTTPQQLLISSGKAAFTFLKFKVEDLITDQNLFIGGANLYLYVNPDLTESYNKSYTIYVSLLDSTDWDDLTYSPSTSDYVTTQSFSASDSGVFVLNIPYTVQLFTSGYNGNFGVALWITTSSLYPGILSFYPTEDSDSTRRPYMKILTMQEE